MAITYGPGADGKLTPYSESAYSPARRSVRRQDTDFTQEEIDQAFGPAQTGPDGNPIPQSSILSPSQQNQLSDLRNNIRTKQPVGVPEILRDSHGGNQAQIPWQDTLQNLRNGQPQTVDSVPNGARDVTPPPLTLFGQNIAGLGPTSGSTSTSSGRSGAYSGIDKANRDKLLSTIIPELLKSVTGAEGNIDRSTQAALEQSRSLGDQFLKESIPDLLDQLNAKGIIRSTPGKDILSKVLSGVATTGADRTLQSGIEGARMKANLPAILGNLANIGRFSESSNVSSGGGSSFSEDTSAPFDLLRNVYRDLMA